MVVAEGPILAVDERGVLVPATELVFNDAPWLALGGGAQLRLVHPKLSHEVAEKVGVRSLRRMMLAQSADSMNLG